MTIGKYGYNPNDGPNPDFICLKNCRETLSKELNWDWRKLDLSMGMSTDYEQAVRNFFSSLFVHYRHWVFLYELYFLSGGVRKYNGANWNVYFWRQGTESLITVFSIHLNFYVPS